MTEEILLEAFRKAGVVGETTTEKRRLITNIDLYEYGFSGRPNSQEKRKKLLKRLSLPERLSTSSLVKILNTFVTYEEFVKEAEQCE